MKRYFIFLTLFTVHLLCHAQGGIWTWVKGSSRLQDLGSTGTMGVTDSISYPPGKYEAGSWTDLDGNFWIFGGLDTLQNETNDLWKYDPTANTWTWVSGSIAFSAHGVYGIQGVPGPNNIPGARGWGMRTWTDQQGHLWLHGGYGYSDWGYGGLDDVWMYDIPTNQWTWMAGTTFVGGSTRCDTVQVASIYNTPGARDECNSTWLGTDSTLWMYGGQSRPPAYYGTPVNNDVWKFDIKTNLWICMNAGGSPSFGSLNVPSASNMPPQSTSYTHWYDGRNLYIFAGGDLSNNFYYNDVWKYDPIANLWTWVGGDNNYNNNGLYTQMCSPGRSARPGSRIENRTAQMSGCTDVFWTFGGFDAQSAAFNDLWSFDHSTGEWLWVSGGGGSSYPGNYGTIGIPSSSNLIPARGGPCMWVDHSGKLWIWGGLDLALGNYSDMWTFVPDSSCIGRCIDLSDSSFVMPNAFSPNGDNKNDLFYPVFNNPGNQYVLGISVASFKIYNRWGQLIYDDPSKGWDGKYKGELQPQGIYTYFVNVNVPDKLHPGQMKDLLKQGIFTLLR